jgi:hypothetical protein
LKCRSQQRERLLLVAAEAGSAVKITRFRTREPPNDALSGIWSGCIEPFAGYRDKTGLGHCNFQFYGNAARHYFSPAALLVCRRLPLQVISKTE